MCPLGGNWRSSSQVERVMIDYYRPNNFVLVLYYSHGSFLPPKSPECVVFRFEQYLLSPSTFFSIFYVLLHLLRSTPSSAFYTALGGYVLSTYYSSYDAASSIASLLNVSRLSSVLKIERKGCVRRVLTGKRYKEEWIN